MTYDQACKLCGQIDLAFQEYEHYFGVRAYHTDVNVFDGVPASIIARVVIDGLDWHGIVPISQIVDLKPDIIAAYLIGNAFGYVRGLNSKEPLPS